MKYQNDLAGDKPKEIFNMVVSKVFVHASFTGHFATSLKSFQTKTLFEVMKKIIAFMFAFHDFEKNHVRFFKKRYEKKDSGMKIEEAAFYGFFLFSHLLICINF